MENINQHILNLIASYSSNSLNEDEFEELHSWLDQKPENQQLFIEYIRLYKKSRQVGFLKNLNSEKAWASILGKLNPAIGAEKAGVLSRVVPLWGSRFKYMAAASVIIAASAAFYLLSKSSSLDHPGTRTVSVSSALTAPGTSRAVLTLEDGSEVELKKGQTFRNANAAVNGTEIVYHTAAGRAKQPLYNYLTIPRGGQFYLQLSDHTKVWLNSETKLRFPVDFIAGRPRGVELVYGEAYFEVSPSSEHGGDRFKVTAAGQEVEVLGTQFNIKAYEDEKNIYTTLLEGSINLNVNGTAVRLQPGEQSVLNRETSRLLLKNVETKYEVGWKNGLFTFNNKNLKDIMQVLSRWYNVEIVFADRNLEKVEFKGQINRNQDIENILKLIQKTNYIKAYEIKDNIITIK